MICPEVTIFRNVRPATDQWRLVTDSTSVVYFHLKVSNVNKVANFYGIVLIPSICFSF